ncbi:TRAFAC class myosin-kinesin ATPase superfamily protein [Pleurotus pulmonarius]
MVSAGSITVAVRVRPPTSWEAARLPEPNYEISIRGDGTLSTPLRPATSTAPLRDIVQIVDDRILTFDPNEKDQAKAFVERGFVPPGTKRYKDRRFMFDKVFGHSTSQSDVYGATARPLLKGLLDGYNATVFAYGATGCGKTHTISGTDTDPGIIYLTMADLFQRIEDRSEEWNVEVMVTFLEIYNEEIRDLLAEPGSVAPKGGLNIREDKTVKVVGLTELRPRTADEVKSIVLQGNLRRTQSPTHANETSSRSHAVLQVHVMQSPRTPGLSEQRTVATLSIIDLAGSERAAATMNMGQRMVEGANINKSLLALGNCINALCESGGAIRHVPYRNSKLTRLLKFSLGGNCKTVMIVCVAPTSNHFDDTHNTLIYAERATKIKTKVVTRNVVNVDRHVGRYVEAINRLNNEIAELKAKLGGKRDKENEIQERRKAEARAEVERAKSDLQNKIEQSKSTIADGAACSGKISVAKVKLSAINARISHIEALPSAGADLEAERALLKALATPEEEVVKPQSIFNTRLQRSSNSSAMLEATLRAASERRSDKLDAVSVDNIKLDTQLKKTEIERIRAESERDAMNDAVSDMAQVMVTLIGILGRCTVMVGEAARLLQQSPQGDAEGLSTTAQTVRGLLNTLKEKNDDSFKSLVGHSTEGYTLSNTQLDAFSGYDTTFTRRISSGPAVMQNGSSKSSSSRRTSTYGANPPSPRRSHRTPRKSLRTSINSQPYRRVSNEKKPAKPTKNVQWKDEAGQGELDDRSKSKIIVITPGTPDASSADAAAPSSTSSTRPSSRATSVAGSESEWEDEAEKTDDSFNLSFMSSSLPPSTGHSGRPHHSRPRPGFSRNKPTRGSTLGSLTEDYEGEALNGSPQRRPHPLADRSMNQFSENSLMIPKGRDRLLNSPSRRGPSTNSSGSGLNRSVNGRRRSNVGPMRNEKGRRRSSLIPQLSPRVSLDKNDAPGEVISGPRRVAAASPGKRMKRLSLSGSKSMSFRTKNGGSVLGLSIPMGDLSSADISFKGPKPTWR